LLRETDGFIQNESVTQLLVRNQQHPGSWKTRENRGLLKAPAEPRDWPGRWLSGDFPLVVREPTEREIPSRDENFVETDSISDAAPSLSSTPGSWSRQGAGDGRASPRRAK